MPRALTIAGILAILALLTVSVVWAGLNWPPPLWIVEYGLPGAQGRTGRVARIEGIDFVEVSAGYTQVGIPGAGFYPLPESLIDRLLPALWEDVQFEIASVPLIDFCRAYRWSELVRRVWVNVGPFSAAVLVAAPRLPFRRATAAESSAATGDWRLQPTWFPMGSAFSLAPGHEHLVDPYLVKGK